jgi:predicted nucleic acid-binding protein
LADALDQIAAWMEAPNLVLLSEANGYWTVLRDTLLTARATGAHVHDARIAALCRFHGIQELWTADRDFGRFPELTVRNPLVA